MSNVRITLSDGEFEVNKRDITKMKIFKNILADLGQDCALSAPLISWELLRKVINAGKESLCCWDLPRCIWAADYLNCAPASIYFCAEAAKFLDKAKPEDMEKFINLCNKV